MAQYMIRQPNGTLLPDVYESLDQIPKKAYDRLRRFQFDVDDSRIVEVTGDTFIPLEDQKGST